MVEREMGKEREEGMRRGGGGEERKDGRRMG